MSGNCGYMRTMRLLPFTAAADMARLMLKCHASLQLMLPKSAVLEQAPKGSSVEGGRCDERGRASVLS